MTKRKYTWGKSGELADKKFHFYTAMGPFYYIKLCEPDYIKRIDDTDTRGRWIVNETVKDVPDPSLCCKACVRLLNRMADMRPFGFIFKKVRDGGLA